MARKQQVAPTVFRTGTLARVLADRAGVPPSAAIRVLKQWFGSRGVGLALTFPPDTETWRPAVWAAAVARERRLDYQRVLAVAMFAVTGGTYGPEPEMSELARAFEEVRRER